jgi:hypothetical protein
MEQGENEYSGEKVKLPPIEEMFDIDWEALGKKKEENMKNEKKYTEEELNEIDPLTGLTVGELKGVFGKNGLKVKREKTEEEKKAKIEKKEREGMIGRVERFLSNMLENQRTLATFKNTGYGFEDNVEKYEEAIKDLKGGNFEKAEGLILKEMKYAKSAELLSKELSFSSATAHVYSAIERLFVGKYRRKVDDKEKDIKKVGDYMTGMFRNLETLTKESDPAFNFEKKLKKYREATEDIGRGNYENAKTLLLKELKHSRLAEVATAGSDALETYSSIYSVMEKLKEGNGEEKKREKIH